MTIKKLPFYLENTFESLYGNFGSRIAALFLDGLLLCPVTIAFLYCNSRSMNNYYYSYALMLLVFLPYFIYLPVRYGATPGKRIMGLTILRVDGAPITYRESFLKYLPMLAISFLAFVVQAYCMSLADEDTYNSLSWLRQTSYLKSMSPIGYGIELAVSNGFYVANLVVFLLSERKQSIGDHLAGTVAVHTRYLEKIREM